MIGGRVFLLALLAIGALFGCGDSAPSPSAGETVRVAPPTAYGWWISTQILGAGEEPLHDEAVQRMYLAADGELEIWTAHYRRADRPAYADQEQPSPRDDPRWRPGTIQFFTTDQYRLQIRTVGRWRRSGSSAHPILTIEWLGRSGERELLDLPVTITRDAMVMEGNPIDTWAETTHWERLDEAPIDLRPNE